MIRFEDVSVTYRGGVHALKGLDLTVEDGEFVVIVGLSGAGKSTLLRALNGLVPATGGSITVDDTEVVGASAADLRALRSRIGMIFQTFNLVNRTTVLNNVLMGRLGTVPAWRSTLGLWPADDRERAMQALERVGIVEKAYVRAANLSGGQQQRVGIARALVQEPSLMLADEPVASLDPVTSRQVMGDLRRINRELGITTLVNLHFLDLAREFGSRLVGLRDGELVFDGVEEVQRSEKSEVLVRVLLDGDAYTPAVTFFPFAGQTIGTPTTRSTWWDDVQLSVLAVPEEPGDAAVVRVTVQPLVWWIWVGGAVMAVGTLLAVVPDRRRRDEEAPEAPVAEEGVEA